MNEFFRVKEVNGRKTHQCAQCRSQIDAGERHFYCAGKLDGDFTSYREHLECRKAWEDFRTNHSLGWDEPSEFLADEELDSDDIAWLKAMHPIVSARIWKVA